ncbi:roadblock/LC7 domain-containing protein [Streptomyces litchfieldiae]|uniref:Roadblock/LC7 domain-containing protein n=1 Tax=Streptomyces litchfieldiae TaxID=3075543 RepID=A0ABU2MQB7_9ACTN|nr:roadblock/LC7 domain-containing protein [Streptomyces sp. DSM 44938]MDT0343821.1 roadblock/LC7 domain-containing protein [Streptomyces sp. DSM 44938]
MTAPEAAAHGGTPHHGTAHESRQIGRLLDELVERVASVRHALVLAADGLPRGASRSLSREDGEQLAAVASGFHSLAKGVGRHFQTGAARQTLVELDDAFLLVTAAGSGSALAVFAESDADIGLVAYEMALLVKRVGPQLATAPRTVPGGPV